MGSPVHRGVQYLLDGQAKMVHDNICAHSHDAIPALSEREKVDDVGADGHLAAEGDSELAAAERLPEAGLGGRGVKAHLSGPLGEQLGPSGREPG